jgi:hypothetical protein
LRNFVITCRTRILSFTGTCAGIAE